MASTSTHQLDIAFTLSEVGTYVRFIAEVSQTCHLANVSVYVHKLQTALSYAYELPQDLYKEDEKKALYNHTSWTTISRG